MSKARTISTAYASVKSCTEPILKMFEEFHMRILYYVENELNKLYIKSLQAKPLRSESKVSKFNADISYDVRAETPYSRAELERQ